MNAPSMLHLFSNNLATLAHISRDMGYIAHIILLHMSIFHKFLHIIIIFLTFHSTITHVIDTIITITNVHIFVSLDRYTRASKQTAQCDRHDS